MKITVLGSGNGGCTVAADCALHGHEVSICDFEQFPQNINAIREAGGVQSSGDVNGFGKIRYAGFDFSSAIHGAEWIFVVGPSYSHEAFAQEYKKHMENGQTVIICPGTNGGALLFKKEIGMDYADDSITVVETSTLPYATRVLEPGKVHVYLKLKAGLFLASLPSKASDDIIKSFREVYPGSECFENVIQTILQNGNNVIHPAVSLLNVARIESNEDFYFYEEGVTTSVGKLMEEVDGERMAIAEAFGVKILSEPEVGYIQGYMLEKNYNTGYSTAPGFKGILAQTQVDYRYFTEDVGYGLVLLSSMADQVGISTPTIDAIIKLVSVILGTDYAQKRLRTMASFDLDGLGVNDILKKLG